MIFSAVPIRAVDLIGSVLMILFPFLCLRLVRQIRERNPNNVIWTYLLWVCYALAVFAISRSLGHILKQILMLAGYDAAWDIIRPLSGAINTLTFSVVAAITLFFERSWHIYQQILRDQQALKTAHRELLYMNQNLEQLVETRTRALAHSEKQMAQADKLASIGQLSAGVAHEINNPLGIILGYTQLLLRNESPDSERCNDLRTIEKHVRNCKSIVERLLNFSRSSKPKKEMVRVHEVIDDVLNFIKHQSNLDHIDIEKDYDPKLPPMLLDEKKIRQVLVNLFMNARHSVSSTGGSIILSTRFDAENHAAEIRIRDTGYGIEQKNLSRIFDPFFTTKPTGEGTGLGLSVSYGIIKNHGGDISVESEPGKGSAFTIMLPVVTEYEEIG
ncbi:MAG: PAS domain-containing sensor histidine kinase [Desulfobacteraceae bacterium 4572_88]|nr:MAG: PAS domain-containing sensor histidine kinase [Desulfobacteraceae bacterium 4572_88]